jgi:(R,R)-butanediol dehydrogenase/meso-butanediol dehydrogenase/diacetyl reductase
MLAAVYHGVRDVRVEAVPDPPTPAPHEVQLRVLRGAICGTDASEYVHGPRMIPIEKRHVGSGHKGPTILGHEFVGVIEAAGAEVDPSVVGTRVVAGAGMWCGDCRWCADGRTNLCASYYTVGLEAHGGFAERVNVPSKMCVVVPEGCSDEAAAIGQPLAVALHALRRVGTSPGDDVALIGAGGIGLFVLAGLVARGARVTAIDRDPRRLEVARLLGAAHLVDPAEMSAEAGIYDVVVEASGAPGTPELAQRLTHRGGRLLLVGLQKAPAEVALADLVLREINLVTSNAHVCAVDLPEALQLLAEPGLARAAIDRVVPLDELVERGLEPLSRGEPAGKVVIEVDAAGAI